MSFEPFLAGPQPGALHDRGTFIRQTYTYLSFAVMGFILLSAIFMVTGIGEMMLIMLSHGGRYGWLVVLGAFMLVSMMATRLADNVDSEVTQRIGLAIYVLAEALIFARC